MIQRKILCGKRLQDIRTLQDSIACYGLLSPIIAIKRAGQLVVVDGRKRLAAIKRLSFEGRLPRSLAKIPYLLVTGAASTERRAPMILSNSNLYDAVLTRFKTGDTINELTEHFRISHQCVRDILTLSRLNDLIRMAFFNKIINFAQARAYAAMPRPDDQLARFNRLGPFARPMDILVDPHLERSQQTAIAA
ncbi:MAG: ParB N-terminal domain-containing protein [Litorimonas sp.]